MREQYINNTKMKMHEWNGGNKCKIKWEVFFVGDEEIDNHVEDLL